MVSVGGRGRGRAVECVCCLSVCVANRREKRENVKVSELARRADLKPWMDACMHHHHHHGHG